MGAPRVPLASITVVSRPARTLPRRLALIGATIAITAAPALSSASPVDALLDGFAAKHPRMSALVTRLDTGGPVPVAAVNARQSMAPASTMKIITSAAALLTVGPDFRFTTRIEGGANAQISPDGTLSGPAYLIGSGDPMLATTAYSRGYLDRTGTPIERLAINVRRSGVRKIAGGLVIDESLFDAKRMGPQWKSDYVWECGPLSAIATNQGRAGNDQSHNVSSPGTAAGQRLVKALRHVGVTVHGSIRVGRDTPGGTVLGEVKSKPLSTILGFMNPASDNFTAEMLTKDVGAYGAGHGTTAAGTDHAAKLLKERGALATNDDLVDGSGLSHSNRLAASTLVTILNDAESNPEWGDALVRSLEHGGEGTLIRRLRDPDVRNRVRAKTGYIDGVASLAGVVTSKAGARYAFAFLINDTNIGGAQRTMDQAVSMLARGAADGSGAVSS
jgi:D-alanyl-D-alanine carboxypeptidase/D-alanyl-D-alanine-endopeptidase (penicillin-binding protein 4)